MTRLNIIFLLLVLVVFSSCVAKKRAAEFAAQPEWVKQKPHITGYYVGVGYANKIGTAAEYIKKSKQDALVDLAGEVSVQISSSSVLHTIETQYGNTDFFDQRIEVITDDYLEGFESVDTYENDDNYWVYYRINKKTYFETKAKRKEEATKNALAKYIAGHEAQEALNPKDAITFYLQGLSAIRQYLGEETPVDIDGQKTDMGNTLYVSLNQVTSSLSIAPVFSELSVKSGENLSRPLQFIVYYEANPIKGIPVSANYSGGYLNNNILFTGEAGRVSVDPGTIHSKNEQEHIIALIDIVDIANKATEDLFIRGLLTNQKQETVSVKINILLPKFAISIGEDFCKTGDCESIIQLFEKNILNSGYLTDTVYHSDYIFHINLYHVDGVTAGDMTSVYLAGNIKLMNDNAELIWIKQIANIKGVGKSKAEANEKAFAQLLKNLNLIYFRQGLAAVD